MAVDGTSNGGLSDVERAAVKQRAAELRAEAKGGKGSAKREREAQACVEAIAALTDPDRTIAERLHRIVADEAPDLDAKTWYGFPSYARDGKVLVFYQPREKFDTRYGTVGFQDVAALDDGAIWATSFAVTEMTDEVEARLRETVRRAAG